MRRIFGLIALAAIAAIAAACLTGCGGGTTYKAKVQDYNVINPADLGVTVQVTNTGSKAGTPSCTIDAQDPSFAYSGVDVATLKDPVAPGATTHFADNITITGQGAQYVTQVTVKCT
jgi:hypothetical protein